MEKPAKGIKVEGQRVRQVDRSDSTGLNRGLFVMEHDGDVRENMCSGIAAVGSTQAPRVYRFDESTASIQGAA